MSNTTDIANLKTRVINLEERLRDLTIAHQQFVSNLQVQELIATISEELATVGERLTNIETRLTIVEELPDNF